MALSGNIESKFAGGSTGGYYIGIDWTVNSQSVSSNSSNVTATVYIRSSGSGYSISSTASKNVSLTMDGSAGSTTNTIGIGVNTRKNLYTRTINIGHDSSGNKTATLSTTVGVNVTLSGTYYGNVSASGNAVFNKINLNSAPYWTSDDFRINDTRAHVTVPSNTSSITLQPPTIADNEGNLIYYDVYRYVNDQRNATLGAGLTSPSGWADNVSGFGEGTKIHYLVQAHDGQYWAGDRWSWSITKSTLSPAYFTGTMPSFVFTHGYGNAYTFTWSNPSNSNGNTNFNCEIWIDGVSTYNRYVGNVRSTTVTVWDGSGTAPSGPYVYRDHIRDYINNNSPTNKQMNMTARIRTHNDYGVWKDNTANVWVDFRTAPSVPSSISISTNKTYSTALIAVAGSDYWVPNGSRAIRMDWGSSIDYLGGGITYDLYGKYAGESYTLLAGGLTSLARDVVLPAVTSARNYNFKIVAKTSYGYTSERESGAIVLHYYNPPTITFGTLDRKETDFSVPVTTATNSSISAVIFNAGSRTFSGVTSGTITTSPQTVSKTGLVDATSYTLTVTATDNSGLSGSTTTKALSIPAYVPIVSIREPGLGVNAFADSTYKLKVGGKARIESELTAALVSQDGYNTTNTSNTYSGQWTRVAYADITNQYGDADLTMIFQGSGPGEGASSIGRLNFRIKQQNPMGQSPVGSLLLSSYKNIGAPNFRIVFTVNNSSLTRGELWVNAPRFYETIKFTPLSRAGNFTFFANQPYQADLPTGIQIGATAEVWTDFLNGIQVGIDAEGLQLPNHSLGVSRYLKMSAWPGYGSGTAKMYCDATSTIPRVRVASGAFHGENESVFMDGRASYSDPWSGTRCAMKVNGHIATTDTIWAAGKVWSPRFEVNGPGTSYMASGSGDAATWDSHNLVIRSWWGIGFRDHTDTARIVFDTRRGSISARSDISSEGWVYANGIRVPWMNLTDGAGTVAPGTGDGTLWYGTGFAGRKLYLRSNNAWYSLGG